MKTLILYASVEGHTQKIAQFIATLADRAGHPATLVDAGTKGATAAFDGVEKVILAASVHRKRHPQEFEKFIQTHQAALSARETLFLYVSLCAGYPEGLEEARTYVDDMTARTGFTPSADMLVGGALQFDKYEDYEAWVVRFIAVGMKRHEDIEEDRDLTDWAAVEKSVSDFLGISRPA